MLYEVIGIQVLKTRENKEFKILHTLSDFSKRDLANSQGRVTKQIMLFDELAKFDAQLSEIVNIEYDSNGYIYDINHA